MCPPVTDHKDDCDCSACLLRKEEKRKWDRAMKNPVLRKRPEAELRVAKGEGWQTGYADGAKGSRIWQS